MFSYILFVTVVLIRLSLSAPFSAVRGKITPEMSFDMAKPEVRLLAIVEYLGRPR